MTLLAQLTARDVCGDPCPHVVIETALDAALCRRLVEEFPFVLFPGAAQGGANKKHLRTATAALGDPQVSAAWRAILQAHLAPALWTDLLRVFGASLAAAYPHLPPPGGWDRAKVGVLDVDDFVSCDVLLDAKPLLHTPHDGDAPYERWPHIKRFSSLFFGYLYLRPTADDSHGGDHTFYAPKPSTVLALGARQTVDPAMLDVVKVIPYRQNTFVCFMNTPRALQTMAARSRAIHPLLALHFTAYLPDALFMLPMKPGCAPQMLGRELARRR